MLHLINGIQLAGPKLTPETFRAGLFSLPPRSGSPSWAIGGHFGPGHLAYADDVIEIWWDPTQPNPKNAPERSGYGAYGPGAYRYVGCGKRYRLGEFTAAESLVFKEGCVTAAS